MIPKVIHYCWFGPNKKPEIVEACISSWRAIMPDYVIKEWNETNVPISEYQFMRDAYTLKKWAFVSDYARYWILKQHGGFFLDTDVEVLKSFNPFLSNKLMFGFAKHIKKNVLFVNPGLVIGVEKSNDVLAEILSRYDNVKFINQDGSANTRLSSPRMLTKYLLETTSLEIKDKLQHLENGITIYPTSYFDPVNPRKLFGIKLKITKDTYAIHHGTASWVTKSQKRRMIMSIILREVFGDSLIDRIRGNEKFV